MFLEQLEALQVENPKIIYKAVLRKVWLGLFFHKDLVEMRTVVSCSGMSLVLSVALCRWVSEKLSGSWRWGKEYVRYLNTSYHCPVYPGGKEETKGSNRCSTEIFVEAMTWESVMSFRLQDYKVNPLTSHSISSTTLYRETIFKVASFSCSTLVVACSPTW